MKGVQPAARLGVEWVEGLSRWRRKKGMPSEGNVEGCV